MSSWQAWFEFGATLPRTPGVHAPSRFSALLAAALNDCTGRTVVDAGCGAGLITIAALRAGARHVIAIDADPAAVDLTRSNVPRSLRNRLTTRRLDFRDLAELDADLLAVNPPQRPESTLDAVEPDQRHLHTGGGPDGLDTLRLVLRHARVPAVRTTAAAVLPIHTISAVTSRRLLTATLPMHPAWHPLTGPQSSVSVWELRPATGDGSRPGAVRGGASRVDGGER